MPSLDPEPGVEGVGAGVEDVGLFGFVAEAGAAEGEPALFPVMLVPTPTPGKPIELYKSGAEA